MMCYIFRDLLTMRPYFLESPKLFMVSFSVFLFSQIISFQDELSLVSPSAHSNKNIRISLFICFLLHTCCATISRNFSGIELYGSTNQYSPFTLLVILKVNLPSSFLLNPGKNFLACSSFSKLEALKRGKPKNHLEI